MKTLNSYHFQLIRIHCGKTQADNKDRTTPVHYSTICKWEPISQDKMVAQSLTNIFYKLKKVTNETFKIVPASLKEKAKQKETNNFMLQVT